MASRGATGLVHMERLISGIDLGFGLGDIHTTVRCGHGIFRLLVFGVRLCL